MRKLRTFLDRVSMLFRRSRLETDIDEEIRSHLAMEADEHRRKGLNPDEARQAALRNFGGVDQVRERYRDHYRFNVAETILQDVRFAIRTLRKNPGFTTAAMLMLSLGIGVNAVVFTLTNAVLFRGFPFVDRNDRVVYIGTRNTSTFRLAGVSYPDLEDWRDQANAFEGIAAYQYLNVILNDESGAPEIYGAAKISPEGFKLIGQGPVMGRDFASSDEAPGAAPVAILDFGLWEQRFGKDPALIGQTIRINGIQTTVIGVMPQGFYFPIKRDLWIPFGLTPNSTKREVRDFPVFARLADNATTESAQAEMETIGSRLASVYPGTNKDFSPVVQTITERHVGSDAAMIYGFMWGAVGFVLLIACANLANLVLARAIGRSREISVRIALGAGRWRIVRQLMIESMMISAAGGVFGWMIAKWGVRMFLADLNFPLSPFQMPTWYEPTMDYRVLGYLIAISAGTGLLFGLVPALRVSRIDIHTMLKDGARGAIGGLRGKRLSNLLVIGEMALALVLLAGAWVLVRSFLNIYTTDVGIQGVNNILVSFAVLPPAKFPGADTRIAFLDRLTTRLEAVPGVESIGIANAIPTDGSRQDVPYELADTRRTSISTVVVSPGYFRTFGAAIRSGREFTDADGPSEMPVVIVNELFSSRYWPGEDPVGKRLRAFDGDTPGAWLTVVGVTPNILQGGITQQDMDPVVYVPYRQDPSGLMVVYARIGVPLAALASTFRREIIALDADFPILEPFTLAERLEGNYRFNGTVGFAFLTLASIALLLASIGLYAVIAHSISQRTQEIGVRMAVGATTHDILKLVFKQGMLPLGIGLAIGLAASFAVIHLMKSALVQVSPADPVTYIVASAVLVFSATLGCWIPARRAMRVDPVVALRHE